MEKIERTVSENICIPATEEVGTPPPDAKRIKVTIETTHPETGEPYTKVIEGQGLIFGVLVGEVENEDSPNGYNVAAGAIGKFCDRSLAISLNALEGAIYEQHPMVKLLRDFGSVDDIGTIDELVKFLVGKHSHGDSE